MAKQGSLHFNTELRKVREALRSPDKVLNSLQSNTVKDGYKFDRIYRNLYNPKFYLLAYQNIYNNKGSMTYGIDGKTLDGMGLERINRIIKHLKDYSYQPNPVRREYIKKSNGKLRPLGIASADDKLVQEVIRMMLESIYEPIFLNSSHGFRPKRSCHTALGRIQHIFTSVKWFVEGDIVSCFDSIDQHVLVQLLRRKIHDEHFIALIWKFLRAGYMNKWRFNETYSGAAQGSIISPILANVYMHEFDKFMDLYKTQFDKGNTRRMNPQYSHAMYKLKELRKSVKRDWDGLNPEDKDQRLAQIKAVTAELLSVPSRMVNDPNYRRIVYCRYADDFLIGVIGTKKETHEIKSKVGEFLTRELHLELSEEKTHITHHDEIVRFLGYDITTSKPAQETHTRADGIVQRRPSGYMKLYVPREKWQTSLLKKGALSIRKDKSGKEYWMPTARGNLMGKTPVEIVNIYNAEIRGLYNYYAIAGNVSVLNKFYYVMEYSMYKTLAMKFNCTMTQAKKKYFRDKQFSVPFINSKGIKKYVTFYNDGFRKKQLSFDSSVDIMPENPRKFSLEHKPRELIVRMVQEKCELCGAQDDAPRVYQVKQMKDLKPEVKWEAKMISMHRKTLVVCHDCYKKIHS